MEKSEYDHEALMQNYIRDCEIAEHPLTGSQMGILENTINGFFEVETDALPKVDKRFDFTVMVGCAENECYRQPEGMRKILNEYVYGTKDPSADCELSDGDVLRLYSLIADDVEQMPMPRVKKKHGLPKGFGNTGMKLLHHYLQARGLVDESKRVPWPRF